MLINKVIIINTSIIINPAKDAQNTETRKFSFMLMRVPSIAM